MQNNNDERSWEIIDASELNPVAATADSEN